MLAMRRREFLAAGLAAAGASLVGGTGLALASTRWDMSFAWPSTNFHVRNGRLLNERLLEATQGSFGFEIHDGGSLGIKGPEAMAAVRDGIVPIAEYSFEQQAAVTDLANFGAMPGLAMGYEETASLIELLMPALEQELPRLNQKLIYVVPWPGQGIYTKKPLNSVKDLVGLKIRAANNNAFEFLEAVGASPILMPWAEVVPALASGVIDGVATSSTSGVDGKFWEFMSDFSRLDWCNPLSFVTANLDSYEALSETEKQALTGIAAELQPKFWQVSRDENDVALATLKENGLRITDPSPEFKAEVVNASAPLWERFEASASDAAKAVLAGFLATKR